MTRASGQSGPSTASRALDCLEEIALEKGLDNVSMRQVAKRLGISLAALQYHYPSKMALIDAFVKNTINAYRDHIQKVLLEHRGQSGLEEVLRYTIRENIVASEGSLLAMLAARAQHDDVTASSMAMLMSSYLETLQEVFSQEFPELSPEEVLLTVTIVASLMEGLASTYAAAIELGAESSVLLDVAIKNTLAIPKLIIGMRNS